MEEILRQVTVAEYPLFRQRVLSCSRLNWSRTQFTDRKNGRIKVHPLELEVLQQIVNEIHKQ